MVEDAASCCSSRERVERIDFGYFVSLDAMVLQFWFGLFSIDNILKHSRQKVWTFWWLAWVQARVVSGSPLSISGAGARVGAAACTIHAVMAPASHWLPLFRFLSFLSGAAIQLAT